MYEKWTEFRSFENLTQQASTFTPMRSGSELFREKEKEGVAEWGRDKKEIRLNVQPQTATKKKSSGWP